MTGTTQMRLCSRCNESKQLNTSYHRNGNGYRNTCKTCRSLGRRPRCGPKSVLERCPELMNRINALRLVNPNISLYRIHRTLNQNTRDMCTYQTLCRLHRQGDL